MHMITTNEKRAYYEITEIIKCLQEDLKNKIPANMIEFFEANKAQDYVFNVDMSKSLEEHTLLPQTCELLTVLYQEFLCDEAEKKLIDEILEENQKLTQTNNELKNVVKKVEAIEETKIEEEKNEMVEVKESFFAKIINKIKNFFKAKK